MFRTRMILAFAAALFLAHAPALAQRNGGGQMPAITDDASAEIDRLMPSLVAKAAALGVPVTAEYAPQASADRFEYPLLPSANAGGFAGEAISNHVDRAANAAIVDFNCGNRSYDGHTGTDIYLTPYAWNAMDRREQRVVAAMAGTIIDKADGNYDRQCTWQNPGPPANYVVVRHTNGLLGLYWHLASGTVTTKPVGATVALGEYLGFVGSSGISTGPHLHFEVRNANNVVIDPYAGACNNIAPLWSHQSRPIDPGVIRVATHLSAPPSQTNCSNPAPAYAYVFQPGQVVYGAAYLRDQVYNSPATVQFVRPDGVVASQWTTGTPSSGFWSSAYWWSSYQFPANAQLGVWRLRVAFLGRVYDQSFWVGPQNAQMGPTHIGISVVAPVRNVAPGVATNWVVNVKNGATPVAFGCRLSLMRPINADVTFREMNSSNVPVGAYNAAFVLPSQGLKKVLLTITPRNGFTAKAAEFGVAVKCTNTAASPYSRTTTMLTLTR